MPKFNKLPNALVSRLDKWLYALKNMTLFKEIPLILRGDVIFEKLFEVAKIANLNQEDMTAYMKAKLDRMDYDRGLQVSKEEGLVEGIEKGHIEEKVCTAEKMFIKGYPVNEIHDCTGLPVAELLQIAERLGL